MNKYDYRTPVAKDIFTVNMGGEYVWNIYIFEEENKTKQGFDKCYSAYLQEQGYGVIDFMYGMPVEQQSYGDFLFCVFNGLAEDIRFYKEEHLEE